MTSCNRNSCGCDNSPQPGATQINLLQAFADGGGCGARWVELASASFIPQDFGTTQTVGVPCASASQFPVGTCVLLLDENGNRHVQKVASHPDAENLSLLAYDNEYSDETTQLSGTIMMFALPLCPVARVEASCSDGVLVTTQAFTMPSPVDDPDNPGASSQVCFDRAMRLTVGTIIFVEDAGFMQVGEPPAGEFAQCSQCFYLYNAGAAGNAAAGATIGTGKTAYPARFYTPPAPRPQQFTQWYFGRGHEQTTEGVALFTTDYAEVDTWINAWRPPAGFEEGDTMKVLYSLHHEYSDDHHSPRVAGVKDAYVHDIFKMEFNYTLQTVGGTKTWIRGDWFLLISGAGEEDYGDGVGWLYKNGDITTSVDPSTP